MGHPVGISCRRERIEGQAAQRKLISTFTTDRLITTTRAETTIKIPRNPLEDEREPVSVQVHLNEFRVSKTCTGDVLTVLGRVSKDIPREDSRIEGIAVVGTTDDFASGGSHQGYFLFHGSTLRTNIVSTVDQVQAGSMCGRGTQKEIHVIAKLGDMTGVGCDSVETCTQVSKRGSPDVLDSLTGFRIDVKTESINVNVIDGGEGDRKRLDSGIVEGRNIAFHFVPGHEVRLVVLTLGLETELNHCGVG